MTFHYRIEKNVPLPPENMRQSRSAYPFWGMEVGDSFLVSDKQAWPRVRSAAVHFGKRNGRKFRAHSTNDGLRVWRVK